MVLNLLMGVLGPMADPECRRALARGWVIAVRTLVAGVPAFVVAFLIWSWWLSVRLSPSELPSLAGLDVSLSITSNLMLTIAMVMTPAVLAGSLSGERERGILQHLLVTSVGPREIVFGRLAGKLSQVGMVLLAAIPFLILQAGWYSLDVSRLLTVAMLMAAVLVGAGGLAIGVSVIARRGRDALMAAYLVILVLLLLPMAADWAYPGGQLDWLNVANPYLSLGQVLWHGEAAPALETSGLWLSMGMFGTFLASWRLLPSCLAFGDHPRRSGRRRRIPPLSDRPMLWKELFIERTGTLGRVGQWLGLLIIIPIGGGSLVLATLAAWSLFGSGDAERSEWAIDGMSRLLNGTHLYAGWLIQLAIGLRAAVSIATERERGTWEGLLASRLEPGEIVYAKLYGALFALRWLLGAVILAWTLGLAVGAITLGEYAEWMVATLLTGILMAAIGIRCSLSLSTATKAMTWTIAMWIGAQVAVAALALAVISIVILACVTVWSVCLQLGLIPPATPPFFIMSFGLGWILSTNSATLLAALLLVTDTRLRFDRLSGRMAEGKASVALDGWLHARQLRPVLLDGPRRASAASGGPPLQAVASEDVAV